MSRCKVRLHSSSLNQTAQQALQRTCQPGGKSVLRMSLKMKAQEKRARRSRFTDLQWRHSLGVTVKIHKGAAGASFWIDVVIVVRTISYSMAAHPVEAGLWAALFVACGEFPDMGTAYYHSAVNYTTLGYGDMVMSPARRLLGPLEAAYGMLMFGVSTAMMFAVILKLVETRFAHLKS